MLRSDTLMLDNKLCPLYQERVTSLIFNTEHSSEHLDTDDPDDDDAFCEESLIMIGTGRIPKKHSRKTRQEPSITYNDVLKNCQSS